MRLEQLQYFVRIVEAHSFNRAAAQLNITQPALSNSIRMLEKELGVELLERSRQGVHPTAWGVHIYEDCKELLGALEEKIRSWKQDGTAAGPKQQRYVSVVAIPSACNYLVEHVIPRVRESLPEIEIVLHEINMSEMYDFMKKGTVHIGVTALTYDEESSELPKYRGSGISAAPLLEDEYRIFLSTRHPLSRKESLDPEDCRTLRYATYSNQFKNRSSIVNMVTGQLGVTDLNYVNSRESIMQLIAQNKAMGCFLHRMTQYSWYITNGMIKAVRVKDMKLLPSMHFLLVTDDRMLSDDEQRVSELIKNFYI